MKRNMLPILLYHQVADVPVERDPRRLAVMPQAFERQMARLARSGYHSLSLGNALRYWKGGMRLPDRRCVLTFDDGTRDFYAAAYPVLAQLGFGATVFLVAGRVGLASDWAGQGGHAAAPLLSWEQVRELDGLGVEFGSHTLTHPRLTHLDDAQVARELAQSKAALEDGLGHAVRILSYPYGASDARVQRIAAETGYEAACGVDRGVWGLYNLWRMQCGPQETVGAWWWKLHGWPYRVNWLREETALGWPAQRMVRAIRRATGRGGQPVSALAANGDGRND